MTLLRFLVRLLIVWPFRLVRWVWRVVSGWEEDTKRSNFYRSKAWRDIARKRRAETIRHWGRLVCERMPSHAGPFHVDHIKPRSRFPDLELDLNNTQSLCGLCNVRKGARRGFNWRRLNRAGLWWLRLILVSWQHATGRR
jgi:5-methylcytosine-specific restriction endonuclease McrA